MTSRSERVIRLIAFVVGVAAGAAVFAFIYSNPGSQNLDWLGLRFNGVPVWSVGVVPLLIGLALGYLYHFPARWHHYKEHTRYASVAGRLAAENKKLREERTAIPPDAAPEAPALPPPSEPAAEAPTARVKPTPAAKA
jgi:hypothetical protein